MITEMTTETNPSLTEVLNQTTASSEVRYCRNQKEVDAFIRRVKDAEARWGRTEPAFSVAKWGRNLVVTVSRS